MNSYHIEDEMLISKQIYYLVCVMAWATPIATSNRLADRHHWSGKGDRDIVRYDWELSGRFRHCLHRKNAGEHVDLIFKKQVTRSQRENYAATGYGPLEATLPHRLSERPTAPTRGTMRRLTRPRSTPGSPHYFSGTSILRTTIQSGYMRANELHATFHPPIPLPSMLGSPPSLPAAKPTGPTIATLKFAMNHPKAYS